MSSPGPVIIIESLIIIFVPDWAVVWLVLVFFLTSCLHGFSINLPVSYPKACIYGTLLHSREIRVPYNASWMKQSASGSDGESESFILACQLLGLLIGGVGTREAGNGEVVAGRCLDLLD